MFAGYDGGGEREDPDRLKSSARPDSKKAKGQGKDRQPAKNAAGPTPAASRFVPEMGRTEPMSEWQKLQWWQNVTGADVLVREAFSLQSAEVSRIAPNRHVQEAGPVEVFVSGQAKGLMRMPILPRGWVTIDASSVGGPVYLQACSAPQWKVIFSSGSSKGDIVVRSEVSLDSDEVNVLLCGHRVNQTGPQEVFHDGIVRMPISWEGGNNNRGKQLHGWVTVDATSQGGPKFFELLEAGKQDNGTNGGGHSAPQESGNNWSKNRVWRVTNIDQNRSAQGLAVVTKAEPYAPDSGKTPSDDVLVTYIKNDVNVEQVGHSKKMRGYMVMPVKIIGQSLPMISVDGADAHGWVTRRLVDKQRENEVGHWFVEIAADGEEMSTQARRSRRDDKRK
jgi:hypothetical protein